jgi:hypothetical protein
MGRRVYSTGLAKADFMGQGKQKSEGGGRSKLPSEQRGLTSAATIVPAASLSKFRGNRKPRPSRTPQFDLRFGEAISR